MNAWYSLSAHCADVVEIFAIKTFLKDKISPFEGYGLKHVL